MPYHGMLSIEEFNALQPGDTIYPSSYIHYRAEQQHSEGLCFIKEKSRTIEQVDTLHCVVTVDSERTFKRSYDWSYFSLHQQTSDDYGLLRIEDSYIGLELFPSELFYFSMAFTGYGGPFIILDILSRHIIRTECSFYGERYPACFYPYQFLSPVEQIIRSTHARI